jgi:hypothetical protein
MAKREIDSTSKKILVQFFQTLSQKSALGFLPGQGKCLSVRFSRLIQTPQTAAEIRAGGVQKMILNQFSASQKIINQSDPGFASIPHGDRHGAIQFHDR